MLLLASVLCVAHGQAFVNHFDVLTVPETATSSEIKSRFRELVMKLHPDKISQPTDADRQLFVSITEAYNVLKATRFRLCEGRSGFG